MSKPTGESRHEESDAPSLGDRLLRGLFGAFLGAIVGMIAAAGGGLGFVEGLLDLGVIGFLVAFAFGWKPLRFLVYFLLGW